METWIRRIRGAIGMGLTWALAWFTVGMLLLLVVGPEAADVPFPVGFGALGFLAGTTFSGVLGAIDGRRRFDQMSVPRFAAWGAVGGLLLSGGFVGLTALFGETGPLGAIGVLMPVFAIAGAASAAGSLALARVGEDRELLRASEDVARVGLSPGESRKLLGDADGG